MTLLTLIIHVFAYVFINNLLNVIRIFVAPHSPLTNLYFASRLPK